MPESEIQNIERKQRMLVKSLNASTKEVNELAKSELLDAVYKTEELVRLYENEKNQYIKIVDQILSLVDRSTNELSKLADEKENKFVEEMEKMKTNYIKIQCVSRSLNSKVNEKRKRESIATVPSFLSSTIQPYNDARLPKFDLPKFDGDPTHWLQFKSIFVNLIHENESLSQVKKLHYLKSSLDGTLEYFLSGIGISEQHYIPVWNHLVNRFVSLALEGSTCMST